MRCRTYAGLCFATTYLCLFFLFQVDNLFYYVILKFTCGMTLVLFVIVVMIAMHLS